MNEYLLTLYFNSIPLQPHSLHLYRFATRDSLTDDSKKFFVLLLRIVPIFPQEGHFEVSGKVLKNILNCKLIRFNYLFFLVSFTADSVPIG